MQQTLQEFVGKEKNQKKFKQRKDAKQEQQQLQWSMSLQQAYETVNEEKKRDIFEKEINGRIDEFIQDKFNHYVIQCVLQNGPQEHKNRIYAHVSQKKHQYWKKKYAYKVIQHAISDEKSIEREQLISYIKKNLDQMKYDQYGNLIIGHLLGMIQDEVEFEEVIDTLNIDKIKYHQYGCLIVIKIVELNNHCNYPIQKILIKINNIVHRLISNTLELTKSLYSNYVVQKLILNCSLDSNKKLLNEYLLPNFVDLAKDKYGSNVCEKVLKVALAYQLQHLWTSSLKQNFQELINDKYANYVMQTYYYHIQLFNYIHDEFSTLIEDMNRQQILNQNGKIVLRFVTQCNPTDLYGEQLTFPYF